MISDLILIIIMIALIEYIPIPLFVIGMLYPVIHIIYLSVKFFLKNKE